MSSSSSFMRVEPIKVSGDDWYWNGEGEDPGDCTRCSDKPAQSSDGDFVSVPDGRHGDDGPPERVGDALDLRFWNSEFRVVDGA